MLESLIMTLELKALEAWHVFQTTNAFHNILEHVGHNNIGCLWLAFYEGYKQGNQKG